MKKVFFIADILLLMSYCVFSQNVGIGTNSPGSKLHIRGNADASQLTIDANSTQSNSHPLIRLRNSAGSDLLHIHADDTTNIFIGFNAAKNYSVTAAIKNNIFIGNYAGFYNTSGYYNTVVGSKALSTNTSGHGNTAYGFQALVNNNNGNYNVALGPSALQRNVSGNYNTAVGANSLDLTYASDYNTALGFAAGDSYDNGYNNVFLGANVDVNGPGYYNVIAIGQGTVCTSVSQVTIGNGATTSYRAYALWSNISDGRYKKNIKENVHGLDFINKLRPVTYNLDAAGLDAFLHKNVTKNKSENIEAKVIYDKALQEKESVTYSGFVAQEVEASAKELGFYFSGVDAPKNANDVYGLRYAEFVVPLVKAVQEQQKIIETQQQKIDDLEKRLIALEKSLGN
ncbi:hypothetical protein BH11BAC3_BH11BAC3_29670 [soil metagenome]